MTGWLLDRPRLAALILAALILLPLAALPRLKLDNAPQTYFPVDAPAVQFNRELRRQFPEDQVLVALFAGGDLWEPATLGKLHRLVAALEQLPDVERVLSVTSADRIAPTPDGFAIEPLVDPRRLDSRDADAWRQRATSDRFASGLLVARDGSALAVVVRPHRLNDSHQRQALETSLRAAVVDAGLDRHLRAVAGDIALDVAELRSMITDSATFVPATLVVGLGLLWWMFRRWLVLLLAAAAFSAVSNCSIALLALAGRPYTLVSAMMPPLLLALTTAGLMHLFSAVAHGAQLGLDGRGRLLHAVGHVRLPARFAMLTTVAGLWSLAVTPIRPIADFGIVAGLGVLIMYVVTQGLLPALILRHDLGRWRVRELGIKRLTGFVRFTTRLALRRAGWVLALFGLGLALGLPQVRHIIVETSIYNFFPADHRLTRDTHRVEQALSGVMVLEVVFTARARDGLTDPAALRAIRDAQNWLDRQPEVDRSLSLPDLVEEMHWAFQGGEAARSLPRRQDLISQYLLIYDGRDLYDLVDRDLQRTRLLLNLNVHGAGAINTLIGRLRTQLAAQPPGDLQWELAGMGRLFADQERLQMQGQISSGLAVLGMVFGLLVLLWRSLRDAAIAMVPNAAPIALTFILMGALGIWLDMATALIASVATGIAVDDTIYLYQGYRERRRAGAGPVFALARTLRRTGPDCVATALVLAAQFALFGLSQFIPTAQFGLLTGVGLATAVLFDLLLLPALLLWLDRR